MKEFYGGAVGMVTPTLDNICGREAFLIMGGPVASLAVGAIATTAALGAKGHVWEPCWAFLSMCAAMGWASFVINLIPLKSAARYSDGAQLYQLVSGGEWAQFHIAFAMVASSLVTPIRPRDFNVSTINRAAGFITQGERGLLLRLFACIHYLDAGRVPEALASMQAAEDLYEQSTFEKPEDICAEFVYINAFHKRDLAAAELWWRRIESLKKSDRDADYWRARTALLLLKGDREEARAAWERGNALAQKLPAAGVYEGTRACFAKLRAALDAPVATNSMAAAVRLPRLLATVEA
jgi:tetratricopeptide (TPR) repeat protein